MRTVPAAVTTEAAKAITAPTYLVRLEFATPIHLTTGATPTFDGNAYTRKGLSIEAVSETRFRFSVRNDDLAFSAILSDEGAADIPVTLSAYYVTDGVIIWTGFLDGARIARKEVQFRASRVEAAKATFPEKFFHRGQFPYMPNDGTVLKWGSTELTLRSR